MNQLATPAVDNQQNPSERVHSERQEALLAGLIVRPRERMLVRESCRGVSEVDIVLSPVLLGLLRVPFEHGLEYMYACAYSASPLKAAVQHL